MSTVYRIHVGTPKTASPIGKFSPRHIEVMENTLNRYFTAWAWQDAIGYRAGKREELKIITVTLGDAQTTGAAGKKQVQAFVAQLQGHLKSAVLIEEGGESTLIVLPAPDSP